MRSIKFFLLVIFSLSFTQTAFAEINSCDYIPGYWTGHVKSDNHHQQIAVRGSKYSDLIYLEIKPCDDHSCQREGFIMQGTCRESKINIPDFNITGMIVNGNMQLEGPDGQYFLVKRPS